MKDMITSKRTELQKALSTLGGRLDSGDDSELLVWVIPGEFACAHRPLRHHREFGREARGRNLPPHAAPEVLRWVDRMRATGLQAVISLLHPKELHHYAQLDLGAPDLIGLYEKEGLEVRQIPWDDPAHRSPSELASFGEELIRVREEALQAFDALPKPVLLHCSAGIDRSSPVAAFIWAERNPAPD